MPIRGLEHELTDVRVGGPEQHSFGRQDLLTGGAQTTPDGHEADDVIAAMSQTYRRIGMRYLIRAVIQTRVCYGATSREWGDREYRLVTDGMRTRAESLVAGRPNDVVSGITVPSLACT